MLIGCFIYLANRICIPAIKIQILMHIIIIPDRLTDWDDDIVIRLMRLLQFLCRYRKIIIIDKRIQTYILTAVGGISPGCIDVVILSV